MTIEKSRSGQTAEWKLSGWLDTQSAQELEAELNYISSGGLRQLVAAHKKMNGALTMRHISDEIMGVIKMTGLDKRLKFE